jgi:hypothetical protein
MNKPMEQSGKNPNSIQDDNRLADFTDQVLEGKLKQAESNVDEELLGLEETILRLKSSIPSTPLDQAAVKQMQIRLNARIRRESQQEKQTFWKTWIEPILRPQFGMAFAVVALLVALVVFSPSLATNTGSVPLAGTALPSTPTANILVVSILAGVILIFLWIKRPK